MKTLGILGGGQLARMLIQEGLSQGLEIHVLSDSQNDPAAQVTKLHHKGSPSSKKDLKNFFKNIDLVTFESEFIDVKLLQETLKTSKKISFQPSLKIMKVLQDKYLQKQILLENGFQVSPILKTCVFEKGRKFSFVVKKRTLGYDGYGVFIINSKKDYENLLKKMKEEKIKKEDLFCEEKINFKRELALTAFRNKKNQVIFTPLVETHQEKGRLLWLRGPVKKKGLEKIHQKIKKFLNKISYEGAISFEFFENLKGELLINEVAPRVHNSCHYSQDALSESQFTLHLKAILNEDLKSPHLLAQSFATMNLISSGKKKVKLSLPSDTYVHWYGKKENRKFRKMGHMTCLNQDISFLKKKRKEFVL